MGTVAFGSNCPVQLNVQLIQVLASGNYVSLSPKLVEINMTSMVRNTQSKVNCAMVSQAQLNCTTDSGAQFTLVRRS